MNTIASQNYKGVIGDGRLKFVNQGSAQGTQEDIINLSRKVDGLEKKLEARINEIADLQIDLQAERVKVEELNEKFSKIENELKNYRAFAIQTVSHTN